MKLIHSLLFTSILYSVAKFSIANNVKIDGNTIRNGLLLSKQTKFNVWPGAVQQITDHFNSSLQAGLVKEGKLVSFFGSPIVSQRQDVAAKRIIPLTGFPTMYLPSPEVSSPSCQAALVNMSTTLWGLKMVDSWGKFPDGLLLGNYQADGMFDQCVRTHSPDNSIRGKYCKVSYKKRIIFTSGNDVTTSPRLDLLLGQVSVTKPVVFGTMVYGTCIPHSCTDQELKKSIQNTLMGQQRRVQYVECQEEQQEVVYTSGDIGLIVFLCLIGLLMIVCTAMEVYIYITNNKKIQQGPFKYVMPFSVYSNLGKLFHVTTQNPPGTITCLHGLRVLSMTWVVFGHQHIFNLEHTSNLFYIGRRIDGIFYQIILNATLSTDSFFFMSGLLVAYLMLKEVKKTGGKFNAGMFYVHRIIRLTPPLALVCWFMATLSKHLISGPYVRDWNYFLNGCQKFWWRDVLYVSNFVFRVDVPGESIDCLGQCWYTSVDTQLYFIAPLLILPLYFYPKAGKLWLYVLTVASLVIPGVITYVNDLPPGSIILMDPAISDAYYKKIYLKPWSRAGAWIVGIWLGYIIYEQGNNRFKLQPLYVATGWTVATVTALLVLLGIWSYNTFSPMPYDPVTQVVYGALHRAVWCACLAWMVFACHNGYGGMVNGFLSHPSWQPLSRLTYTMFLVAFPTQGMIASVAREANYYTNLSKIIETCGVLLITGIGAIVVSLVSESPVLGLEKLLLRRPGRENQPIQVASSSLELKGVNNDAFTSYEMEKKVIPPHQETDLNHVNIGYVQAANELSNFDTVAGEFPTGKKDVMGKMDDQPLDKIRITRF